MTPGSPRNGSVCATGAVLLPALVAVAAVAVVALAEPTTATANTIHARTAAAGGGAVAGLSVPFAFLGFLGDLTHPISTVLKDIANGLFTAIAHALIPSFVTHAGREFVEWLCVLPDITDRAQWPTMHALQQDLSACGYAFLPLTAILPMIRSLVSVGNGLVHPAEGIGKAALGAVLIHEWPWLYQQAVALVNGAIVGLFSFSDISHGLSQAIGVIFGGTLLTGGPEAAGALLALAVIGACIMVLVLLLVKTLVMYVLALVYVPGGLALGLHGLPGGRRIVEILIALLGACGVISVLWAISLAISAAFTHDILTFHPLVDGQSVGSGVSNQILGFGAALVALAFATWMPFMVFKSIRHRTHAILNGGRGYGPTTGTRQGNGGSGGGGASAAGGRAGSLIDVARGRTARRSLTSRSLAAANTLSNSFSAGLHAAGVPTGSPAKVAGKRLASTRESVADNGVRATAAGHGQAAWQAVKKTPAALKAAPSAATRAAGVVKSTPGAVYQSVRHDDPQQGSSRIIESKNHAPTGNGRGGGSRFGAQAPDPNPDSRAPGSASTAVNGGPGSAPVSDSGPERVPVHDRDLRAPQGTSVVDGDWPPVEQQRPSWHEHPATTAPHELFDQFNEPQEPSRPGGSDLLGGDER